MDVVGSQGTGVKLKQAGERKDPASSYPITDRFPPKSKKFSRQACLTLKQRCVFPMEADLQELPEHELLSLPIEEIRGVKRLLEKLVNRETEASVRQECMPR